MHFTPISFAIFAHRKREFASSYSGHQTQKKNGLLFYAQQPNSNRNLFQKNRSILALSSNELISMRKHKWIKWCFQYFFSSELRVDWTVCNNRARALHYYCAATDDPMRIQICQQNQLGTHGTNLKESNWMRGTTASASPSNGRAQRATQLITARPSEHTIA